VARVGPGMVSVFAFFWSRGPRRGQPGVRFPFYLVAVRSPRQAKCAFSRLSCRGAPAAASKVCIFAFILSRCARRAKQSVYFAFILSRCTRRAKQSVHFRVYLVSVRSPWQARRKFSRLSFHGSFVVLSLASHFPVLPSHVYSF